jgi:hypothetical protein
MYVLVLANRTYKTRKMYSFHGSLVEYPRPIRVGACSSPGTNIIFKLGLSLSHHEKADD